MNDLSSCPETFKAVLQNPEKFLIDNGVPGKVDELSLLVKQHESILLDQKTLKETTGKLSRRIGELKKAKQPIDKVLAEMHAGKARKTQLLAQLKQCELGLQAIIVEATHKSNANCEINDVESRLQIPVADVSIDDYQLADNAACEDFLNSIPSASVYHLPIWCQLIERVFGHAYFYLLAKHQGEVVGLLPVVMLKSNLFGQFGVSMPYFNYGGPLALSPDIEALLITEAKARATKEGLTHIEFRCLSELSTLPGHQDKVSMWLSLPETAEQLWQQIGTKIRAQVKKAERFEFSVHIGGIELLDDFYTVFAENMRDLGTPVYGKSFFSEILKAGFGERRLVLLKTPGGEVVSASFLIGYQGKLEVPWASTLRKYNQYNANMLLYWTMLKYACDQQYHTFDFGRSSADAATFKFKKQWGAKPVQLHWHYWLSEGADLPQLNPHNPKFQLAIKIWQKLPVWLTKLIGPILVKNLP